MTDARETLVEMVVALYADKYQITDAWLASAAIDLVLEQAARVVMEEREKDFPDLRSCARAIRALKSGNDS